MAIEIEDAVYALIRKYNGMPVFSKPTLTPETDLDADLKLEKEEIRELMQAFFAQFSIDSEDFNLEKYYPSVPLLHTLLNPFAKEKIPEVPDLTIGMLIESAKAGHWLYD